MTRRQPALLLIALVATSLLVVVAAAVSVRVDVQVSAWLKATQIWEEHWHDAVFAAAASRATEDPAAEQTFWRHIAELERYVEVRQAYEQGDEEALRERMRALTGSHEDARRWAEALVWQSALPTEARKLDDWRRSEALVAQLADLVRQSPQQLSHAQIRQTNEALRQLDDEAMRVLVDNRNLAREVLAISEYLQLALIPLGSIGLVLLTVVAWRQGQRAVRHLAMRERVHGVLLSSTVDAFCCVHHDTGDVLEANPAFWQLLGRSPDAPLNLRDFIADGADALQRLRRLADELDRRAVELVWRDAEDGQHLVQTTAALVDAEADSPGLVLVGRDVTHQRELDRRMVEMDRMIAIGTLAAGVAHEINNPLTFVIGGVEFAYDAIADHRAVLDEQPEAEHSKARQKTIEMLTETCEALADALDGARRMRDIVADLKILSRRPDYERALIELEPVLRSAVGMVANQIEHRAQLVCDFEPVRPVLGHESKLAQVVLNLLVNAAQAIDEEGDEADNLVSVRLFESGDSVVIEVKDTGKGIAADELPHIFEAFHTTKPVGEGTGLGLAISRQIVDQHDGRITVDSRPGDGATFRVELPAADEEATAALEG